VDGYKPIECSRFLSRIGGPVRKLYDRRGGHAAGFEVTLDHLGDPRVGPQEAAARHNLRSQPSVIQLRRMCGAVSRVIVIAEYNDHIRALRRFVHHPELPRQAHQRLPQSIKEREEDKENEQENEPEEDAAMLGASHGFRSSWRNRSAACSGINALKYTSLML
jgi:hypothetical protein